MEFSDAVKNWCDRQVRRIDVVYRDSVLELYKLIYVYTPVDTGYLRSSLKITLNPPVATNTSPTGTKTQRPVVNPNATGIRAKDTVYLSFGAYYAVFVEYGTSNTPPRAMMRRATSQWDSIVSRVDARTPL